MTEPTTARLRSIRLIAAAYADDLRNRPTRAERKARCVLVALVSAINTDSLDSLVAAIRSWMRSELAGIDALSEPEPFDLLSDITREMGLPDEDLDELASLRLPDAYSGLG